MKNLNVFRRLDELETQQLHMQVLLREARSDIERLQKETALNTMDALNAALQKKREYARKYYAKKKAERAA
jgi:hypothetical protein